MKRFKIILFLLLSIFLLTACDSKDKTEKKEENTKELSKSQIKNKLKKANDDLTELWNEVICEISHYTYDGTSSIGGELDIEFVVKNSKKYYEKVKEDKDFIDTLSEEYSDLIEAYDKAFEQATIIYDEIHKETPTPGSSEKYRKNIDLFQQYQDYFYFNYDEED